MISGFKEFMGDVHIQEEISEVQSTVSTNSRTIGKLYCLEES